MYKECSRDETEDGEVVLLEGVLQRTAGAPEAMVCRQDAVGLRSLQVALKQEAAQQLQIILVLGINQRQQATQQLESQQGRLLRKDARGQPNGVSHQRQLLNFLPCRRHRFCGGDRHLEVGQQGGDGEARQLAQQEAVVEQATAE